MKLDPEVEMLLARMREMNIPSIETLGVAEAREGYRKQSALFGGPVVEMAEVTDHAADGPAGPIPLRRYRPEGTPGEVAPALLYVHGGGWVIGDIESHDRVCRQIAHRAGCTVVSVGYRLAPEHPMPAGAEDVIAALRWVVDHAATLGLDPARLAVGGDSAGGSLAAIVALAARDANIPLRCQVLIYPGTDNRATAWSYPSRIANADVPPLTRPAMEYFIARFLPDEAVAEDWRVSPLLAENVAGLPPTLLITGSCDALHDEGVLYADRLEAAGVAVLRRNFPGMIHGFIEMAGILSATGAALDTIAFMLRENLTPAS